MVYSPAWMVDFYGKLAGKDSSPMDGMGQAIPYERNPEQK